MAEHETAQMAKGETVLVAFRRRDVGVDDLPAIAAMVHALIVTGADWRRFIDIIIDGLRGR